MIDQTLWCFVLINAYCGWKDFISLLLLFIIIFFESYLTFALSLFGKSPLLYFLGGVNLTSTFGKSPHLFYFKLYLYYWNFTATHLSERMNPSSSITGTFLHGFFCAKAGLKCSPEICNDICNVALLSFLTMQSTSLSIIKRLRERPFTRKLAVVWGSRQKHQLSRR